MQRGCLLTTLLGNAPSNLSCMLGIVGFAIVVFAGANAHAGAFVFEQIMFTGDPAPGTAGTFSSIVDPPSINDSGEVVFSARSTDQQTGPSTWVSSGGVIDSVLLFTDPAPGLAGRTVVSAKQRGINENGDIPLIGDLNTPVTTPPNDTTIWRASGDGQIDLIAEAGGTTVLGEANPLGSLVALAPVMDGAGNMAFSAGLVGGTFETDQGIWAENGGSLIAIAREGAAAPGTGHFFAGALSEPVINGNGKVAFVGRTDATPSGVTDGSAGVWKTSGATVEKVVATGDTAPGAGANRVLNGFDDVIAINNAGNTAFIATTKNLDTEQSEGQGVWKETSGGLSRVVQAGEQAPGVADGYQLDLFDLLVMNEQGRTMFRGRAQLPPVGPELGGLWRETGAGVELVALQGQAAPGTLDGAFFTANFNSPTFNRQGQSAFVGQLTGPGVDSDLALYFVDEIGGLSLVIRESGLFEVAPGDLRTVEQLFFASGLGVGSGNQDGRASAMNEHGEMVFAASFGDGSFGVFTALPSTGTNTITEPSTAILFGLGVLALFSCQRQTVARKL